MSTSISSTSFKPPDILIRQPSDTTTQDDPASTLIPPQVTTLSSFSSPHPSSSNHTHINLDDRMIEEGNSLGDIGRGTLDNLDEEQVERIARDKRRRTEAKGKGKMVKDEDGDGDEDRQSPFEDQDHRVRNERTSRTIQEEDEDQEPEVNDDEDEEAKALEEERRIAENLAKWSSSESKKRALARKQQTLHVLPPAPPIPSAATLARRSSAILRAGSKRVSRALGPSSAPQSGFQVRITENGNGVGGAESLELNEDSPRSKRRGMSQRLNSFDSRGGGPGAAEDDSNLEARGLREAEGQTSTGGSLSPRLSIADETRDSDGVGSTSTPSERSNPFDTPPTTPSAASAHRNSRFVEDLPRIDHQRNTSSPLRSGGIRSRESTSHSTDLEATPRQSIDSPLLEKRTLPRSFAGGIDEELEEDDDPTPRKPRMHGTPRNPFDDGDVELLDSPVSLSQAQRRSRFNQGLAGEEDETDSAEIYESRIYSKKDHRKFMFIADEQERERKRWEEIDRSRRRRAEFGFWDWLICGCWNVDGDEAGEENGQQMGRTNPME